MTTRLAPASAGAADAGAGAASGAGTSAVARASAVAQRRDAVRITPPALRLWHRWLQWLGTAAAARNEADGR